MAEGRLLVGAQAARVKRILGYLEHVRAGDGEGQRVELGNISVVRVSVELALVGEGSLDVDALGRGDGMEREGELPALKVKGVAGAGLNGLEGRGGCSDARRRKEVGEADVGVEAVGALIEDDVHDLQAALGGVGHLDLDRVGALAVGHAGQRARVLSHRVLEEGRRGTLERGARDGDVAELNVAGRVVGGRGRLGGQRAGNVGSREILAVAVRIVERRAAGGHAEGELALIRGKNLGLQLVGHFHTGDGDVLVHPGGSRHRGVGEGVGDVERRHGLAVIDLALTVVAIEGRAQRAVLGLGDAQHDLRVLGLGDAGNRGVVLDDGIGDVPGGRSLVVGRLVLPHQVLKAGHGEVQRGREGHLARCCGVVLVVGGGGGGHDLVGAEILQAERKGVMRGPRTAVDGLGRAQAGARRGEHVGKRELRGGAVERPAGLTAHIYARRAGGVHGDDDADIGADVAVRRGGLLDLVAHADDELAGDGDRAVCTDSEVLGRARAVGKRAALKRRHREHGAVQGGPIGGGHLREDKRGGLVGKGENRGGTVGGSAERPGGAARDSSTHGTVGVQTHRHGLGAGLETGRRGGLRHDVAVLGDKLAADRHSAVRTDSEGLCLARAVGKGAAAGGGHGESGTRQRRSVLRHLGKGEDGLGVRQGQRLRGGLRFMAGALADREGHRARGLVGRKGMTGRGSGLDELVRTLLEVGKRKNAVRAGSALGRHDAGHIELELEGLAARKAGCDHRVGSVVSGTLRPPVQAEHGAVQEQALVFGIDLAQACLAGELVVRSGHRDGLELRVAVVRGNREVERRALGVEGVGARARLHQAILALRQAVVGRHVVLGQVAERLCNALGVIHARGVAHRRPRALGVGREPSGNEGAVGILGGVGVQIERHARHRVINIAVRIVLLDGEAAAHHDIEGVKAELLDAKLLLLLGGGLDKRHLGCVCATGKGHLAVGGDGNLEVGHGDMAVRHHGLVHRIGSSGKTGNIHRLARATQHGRVVGIGDGLGTVRIARPRRQHVAACVFDLERDAVKCAGRAVVASDARLAVAVVQLVEREHGGHVEDGRVGLLAGSRIGLRHVAVRIHSVEAGLGAIHLDDAIDIRLARLVVSRQSLIGERPDIAEALVAAIFALGPLGLDGDLLAVHGLGDRLPGRRLPGVGVGGALQLERQAARQRVTVNTENRALLHVEPGLGASKRHGLKLVVEGLRGTGDVDGHEPGVAFDDLRAAVHGIAALDDLDRAVGVNVTGLGIVSGQVRERGTRRVRASLAGNRDRQQVGVRVAGGVERGGGGNGSAVLAEPRPGGAVIRAALDDEGRAPGGVGRGGAGAGHPSVALVIPRLGDLKLGGLKRVGDDGGGIGATRGRFLRGAVRLVLVAIAIEVRDRVGRIVVRIHQVDDDLVAIGCVDVVHSPDLDDTPGNLVGLSVDFSHAGQLVPREGAVRLVPLQTCDGIGRAVGQHMTHGAVLVVFVQLGFDKGRTQGGEGITRLRPLRPIPAYNAHAGLELVVRGGALAPLVGVVVIDLGETHGPGNVVIDVANRGGLIHAHRATVTGTGVILGDLGLGHRVLPRLAVGSPLEQVGDGVRPLGRASAVVPLNVVIGIGVVALERDHATVAQARVGGAVLVGTHHLERDAIRAQAEGVVAVSPNLRARNGHIVAGVLVQVGGSDSVGVLGDLPFLVGMEALDLVAGNKVVFKRDVTRDARSLVTVDGSLRDLVLVACAGGVVNGQVGEGERELGLGSALPLRRGALRLLGNLGPGAVGGLAVQRHGDVGQLGILGKVGDGLLHAELTKLVRGQEPVAHAERRAHAGADHRRASIGVVAAVNVLDELVDGEAALGIARLILDEAVHNLVGMVLVAMPVLVVHGQEHALGLAGGVLAIVRQREARRLGVARIAGERGPGDHLVAGLVRHGDAGFGVLHVVALAGDAAVSRGGLGHLQRRPALVEGVVTLEALLHKDGNVGQVTGVVAGQVRPNLGALNHHGVVDTEDEGAVLAQGRGLVVADALVLALGLRHLAVLAVVLIPLHIARIAGVRAVLNVLVVQNVVIRGGVHRGGDGGVVDDLLAVGVVLGQALDRGALVVGSVGVVVVPVAVADPLDALVARDHLRVSVGVDGVEREVHVGPLVEVGLDVLVVPTCEEHDVLRAGAAVGEAVRPLVAVLQVGVELGAVGGAERSVIGALGVFTQRLRRAVVERLALIVVLGQAVDGEGFGVLLGDLDAQHAGEVGGIRQQGGVEGLRMVRIEVERVRRGAAGQLRVHVAFIVGVEDAALLTAYLVVGRGATRGVGALVNPGLGERDVDQAHAAVGDDHLGAEEVGPHRIGNVVDVAALVGNGVLIGDEAPGTVCPRGKRGVAVDVGHVVARPVEHLAVGKLHSHIVVVGDLAHAVVEAVARARDEALGGLLALRQVHAAACGDMALGIPAVGVLERNGADDVASLDGVAIGAGHGRAVALHDVGLGIHLHEHGVAAGGVAVVDPLLGEAHRSAFAGIGAVGERGKVDDPVVLGAVGLGEVVGVRGGLEVEGATEALGRLLGDVIQILGAGLVVLCEAIHIEGPGARLAVLEVDHAVAVDIDVGPRLVGHAVGDEALVVKLLVLIEGERKRVGERHGGRGAVVVLNLDGLGAVGVGNARDHLAVDVPVLGDARRGLNHVGVHDGLVGDGAVLGHVGRIGALELDGLVLTLLVLEREHRRAGDARIGPVSVGGEALDARAGDVHLAPLVHELVAHEVVARDASGDSLRHVACEPAGELDGVADTLPRGIHGVETRGGVGHHPVGLGVTHELHGDGDVAQLVLIGAGKPGLGELGGGAVDAHVADGAVVVDDDRVLGGHVARLDARPRAFDEGGGVVVGLVVGDGDVVVVVLAEAGGDALVTADRLLAQEVDVGVAVGVVLGEVALHVVGQKVAQRNAAHAGGDVLVRGQRELDVIAGGRGHLGGRGHRAAVGAVAVERVGGRGPVGGAVVVPILSGLEVDGAGMGQQDRAAAVGRGDVGAVVGDLGVAVVHLIVVGRAVVGRLKRGGGVVLHGVIERGVVGVVLGARCGDRHHGVVDGDSRSLVSDGARGNNLVVEVDGLGLVLAEDGVPLIEGVAALESARAVVHDNTVAHVLHALEALDGLIGAVVGVVEGTVVGTFSKLRVTLYLTLTDNPVLKVDGSLLA